MDHVHLHDTLIELEEVVKHQVLGSLRKAILHLGSTLGNKLLPFKRRLLGSTRNHGLGLWSIHHFPEPHFSIVAGGGEQSAIPR